MILQAILVLLLTLGDCSSTVAEAAWLLLLADWVHPLEAAVLQALRRSVRRRPVSPIGGNTAAVLPAEIWQSFLSVALDLF